MTALQVIIKEAKAIRTKSPKIEWKKAVAQASAIYASKHKGKSPVGKKKAVKKADNKKLGALPIGFKGSIWGVKFKIVNQYDIYNDVSAIMEDTENGSVIVVFDGKGSANDKATIIVSYMSRYGKLPYGKIDDKDRSELKSKMIKFATNMQKEVKEYNAGKKKTIKKQPLNILAPKIKATIVKKAAKKVAKKAIKKHTHWKTVHAHERRVNGVKKKKISEQSILNKIHKVKQGVEKLDEAQHKHMSSVGASSYALYNNVSDHIDKAKKHIIMAENHIFRLKQYGTSPTAKKSINMWKEYIKEQKTHIIQLKKHI